MVTNADALPCIVACMAAGRFIFINIPGEEGMGHGYLEPVISQLPAHASHPPSPMLTVTIIDYLEKLQADVSRLSDSVEQDKIINDQRIEELMARLSVVESAGSKVQHLHLHIDSNVPVPLTMTVAETGAEADAGSGNMTGCVVITRTGIAQHGNITISTNEHH